MYPKVCIGCGEPFETPNFRQRKCRKDCKRTRSNESRNSAAIAKREAHELEFIAVDGEGVSRTENYEDWDDETEQLVTRARTVHDYVLLSVGEKALHNNGAPLTHAQIFEFLYAEYLEHPNAVFVGFFLGYDFSQWFRTLPATTGWNLLSKEGIARRQPREDSQRVFPFPVRHGDWEFDILGMKRFKLRPNVKYEDWPERIVNHKDGTMSVQKSHPYSWMYICDAGSFFQMSLMKVINPKSWVSPIVSQTEYDILARGKAERNTAVFGAEMIEYNRLENVVLARIMEDLNRGFVGDGIKLSKKQWFGPGQAAQEWMKNIDVPTGELVREHVPQWARDAARQAYYGGWFEIRAHGYIPGTTYGYDINSAYPHIISTLPCLLHGTWTHGTGKPQRLVPKVMRLVDATVEGANGATWFGPAPHRTSNGTIMRPVKTRGWHWWHELQASKRAGFLRKVTIHEWVDYKPCKCPPPLAAIKEMYEERLRVGKNTSSGKAKKLVYNSAYGKMAQSVGNPRFANPIYASLITAGCRTMILDAIASHPNKADSVLMIATDAIYFDAPHPSLDLDEERLGAWGSEPHENMTILMPGLYWDEESRRKYREGEDVSLKSRGISGHDLSAFMETIDRAFKKKLYERIDEWWPSFNVPVQFSMISAKLAATRDTWEDCGAINTDPRKLDSKPFNKRVGEVFDVKPYIVSFPYSLPPAGEIQSTPYDKVFGEDSVRADMEELKGLLTPEGGLDADLVGIIPGH